MYDYEQFIPGRTNNLHFTDIRHPFLGTSRWINLPLLKIFIIIIFTIYPKPIASEEAKIQISRSQTTIDNNFNSRNSTKHSKGKYKFCFEEYLSLIFFGKSTNSWSCSL
jgi:hypothetical protein